jgi:hypothetical protein
LTLSQSLRFTSLMCMCKWILHHRLSLIPTCWVVQLNCSQRFEHTSLFASSGCWNLRIKPIYIYIYTYTHTHIHTTCCRVLL